MSKCPECGEKLRSVSHATATPFNTYWFACGTTATKDEVSLCGSVPTGKVVIQQSAACLRRQRDALQAIVDLAVKWKRAFRPGRDVCDEGFSVPDLKTEEALYDAVEAYEAALAAKGDEHE